MSGGFLRDLKTAAGIILLSSILGLAVDALHPRGVFWAQLKATPGQAEPVATSGDAPSELRVVSADTLRRWVREGLAVLLDAREPEAYFRAHLPGARNLPVDAVGDSLDLLQSLPRDRWLVCYCDGAPCDLGERLAYELKSWGFDSVAVYWGGVADWRERGLPMEKGGPRR